MDEGRVIGRAGKLPWQLPEDMRHFKELTLGQTVFMGRKTYESLPEKFRPLPGRKNIVVSRNPAAFPWPVEVERCTDPERYLAAVQTGEIQLPSGKLWIIGGANLYALTRPYWDEVWLTLVKGQHSGDVYFPAFEDQYRLIEERAGERCLFKHYQREA